MGARVGIDARTRRSLSPGVYAERGDYSRSVKLNISGASESFVAWLLADLLHLISGGVVGSMPSSLVPQTGYLEPLLAGATLAISPFLVLFAVFFWTFLWGIPGAFIGVPASIAMLTMCAQYAGSRWLAVLLSDSASRK